ncbi:DUF4192 family protein [Cellulosimicrobium cellulans]|uniref:DUF4192 domain-containing protein n=1 Tax=Cellulosimicrobium cellulans TaxID=1710 RepID=A0A4Y4E705_CELCE|nr:DUF4192 family protein [Cellulosimicrobium cellulans]GED11330.1 hypothetical protein CCE02nite_33290 [Cellulosimicrobium cellulans]
MAQQITLRARSVVDVLAYIPYRIGYAPTESLVIVARRSNTGTVGLVARVDLSDVKPETADMLAVHIANDRAASAVVALYTEDREEADRALASMTEALHGQAVDVHDAVHVSTAGYVDMHAALAVVRPLSDVTTSVLAAEMVALGVAPASDRAGLLPGEASPEAQATARRAAEKHAAKNVDEQTTHALATWRLALTGLVDGPGIYGELAQMLTHTKVRDAALLSMVPGIDPDTVTQTAAGNAPDDATGRAVAAIADQKVGVQPGDAADAARDLLAQIVAHVPTSAPAWTLWGLVAWWHGNGVAAADALARALEADETYRLALLLNSAVQFGMAPGWVVRERDTK